MSADQTASAGTSVGMTANNHIVLVPLVPSDGVWQSARSGHQISMNDTQQGCVSPCGLLARRWPEPKGFRMEYIWVSDNHGRVVSILGFRTSTSQNRDHPARTTPAGWSLFWDFSFRNPRIETTLPGWSLFWDFGLRNPKIETTLPRPPRQGGLYFGISAFEIPE